MTSHPGTTFLKVVSVVLVSSGVGVGLGWIASTQLRAESAQQKTVQSEKRIAFITSGVVKEPKENSKTFTVEIKRDESWSDRPATLRRHFFSKDHTIKINGGVILLSESKAGTLLEIISPEELIARDPKVLKGRSKQEFLARRICNVSWKDGKCVCEPPPGCLTCIEELNPCDGGEARDCS
jgi:hypothetical protein